MPRQGRAFIYSPKVLRGLVMGPPTLASIAPTSGVINTTVPVTLTGTNLNYPLAGGLPAIAVSGTLVTVQNVVVVSPQTITAEFVINVAAAQDVRTVTVQTDAGTSGTVTFTITAGSTTILLQMMNYN